MNGEHVDAIAEAADPIAVATETSDLNAFVTNAEAKSAQFQQDIAIQATLDAFDSLAQAYAGVPGRKALIWMTGSFPFGMPTPGDIRAGQFLDQYQRIFEKLNNANISVYPVDARGLMVLGPTAADNLRVNPRNPGGFARTMQARSQRQQDSINTMNSFADMTGGRAFYNTNDLTNAVAKAADDSASYYVLGYYLKADVGKPGWRKLQVKVKRDGTHVRARSGFFVLKEDQNDQRVRAAEIRTAVSSPFEFTALPVTVEWTGRGPDRGSKRVIQFNVVLNPNSITVDDTDKNHVSLEFLAVARDPTLKVADQVGQSVEANLKPESLEKLRNSGITYKNQLTVEAGDYNVRFVVRDNLSGHIGSLSVPLKVN
jgi:hypothetical protein